MREEVEAALRKVRPVLRMEGEGVELVDVEDGVVKVKLIGACNCHPNGSETSKHNVEEVLRQEVEGIKEIVAV